MSIQFTIRNHESLPGLVKATRCRMTLDIQPFEDWQKLWYPKEWRAFLEENFVPIDNERRVFVLGYRGNPYRDGKHEYVFNLLFDGRYYFHADGCSVAVIDRMTVDNHSWVTLKSGVHHFRLPAKTRMFRIVSPPDEGLFREFLENTKDIHWQRRCSNGKS